MKITEKQKNLMKTICTTSIKKIEVCYRKENPKLLEVLFVLKDEEEEDVSLVEKGKCLTSILKRFIKKEKI